MTALPPVVDNLEYLQCPFCGSKPRFFAGRHGEWVECINPECPMDGRAIEALKWNMRWPNWSKSGRLDWCIEQIKHEIELNTPPHKDRLGTLPSVDRVLEALLILMHYRGFETPAEAAERAANESFGPLCGFS